MSLLKKRRINLQTKFITPNVVGILFTLLLLAFVVYQQQQKTLQSATDERMKGHLADLGNLMEVMYQERRQAILQAEKGFYHLLAEQGGLHEADSLIEVRARDFQGQDSLSLMVPQWLVDSTQLQYSNDRLLGLTGSLSGCYATIFQKVGEKYLIVSTNVTTSDGQKSENLLVSKDGRGIFNLVEADSARFRRIEVAGEWCTTYWAPLKISGEIKGCLFLGIPEKKLASLRGVFQETHYYQTGYPFAFTTEGEYVVHPHSEAGSVTELVSMKQLADSPEGKVRYEATVDGKVVSMLMYYRYFEPFDLYIAASVSEEEALLQPLNKLRRLVLIGVLMALAVSIVSTWFLVRSITRPVEVLNRNLREIALGKSVSSAGIDRNDEIGDIARSVDQVVGGVNAASAFATEIGQGNLEAPFEPQSSEDLLGNALLNMKNSLAEAAIKEKQRTWVNTGIASFSQLLRDYGNDLNGLAEQVLRHTIKYMDMNQGAFYTVENEDTEEDALLKMRSCFAWGRKKFIQQEIHSGEGLAGQVWLEKKHVYLEEIPENYLKIRSGLGGACPQMVLILPLQLNGEVYGIMELASFNKLQQFQTDFLLKVAESIAATLSMARSNEQTRKLLKKTQIMTEELRSQEEEMRQNVEELQATHEEMNRREAGLKNEITELKQANQQLEMQVNKLEQAGQQP